MSNSTRALRWCPCCNSARQPFEEQPLPGDNLFSIKFKCGSQVVCMITGDYWEWTTECTFEDEDDGK